jgi:hypothetical protein
VTLRHFANFSSGYLYDIFVIWIDRARPRQIPSLADYGIQGNRVPIHFLAAWDDPSLNNRFLIPSWLRTKFILSCDDDITIPEAALERNFACYAGNGLSGHIFGPITRGCKNGRYIFRDSTYSLILTGIAFFSVDMLEIYNLPKYRTARDEVTRLFNGEDVLMNFVIADSYRWPPIYGRMPHYFAPVLGISTGQNHTKIRDGLCQFFRAAFGDALGTVGAEFQCKVAPPNWTVKGGRW